MINIRDIKTDPAGQPDQHDLAAITAIYRHHVLNGTASFEIEPPSSSEMATRMAQLLAGGYPILVAMHHNTLCGYAYAGPHKRRAAYNYTFEDSVYVSDDQCGDSIDGQLLLQLIEAAGSRDYYQMMAMIGESDNTALIRLHHVLGFNHIGTEQEIGFKFGRRLDIVYMQRALKPAPQSGST
mgnify:FL=1